MYQQSYDQLVQKVVATGEINQQELKQRVEQKVEQLNGMVSKEGAVHIIANELGLSLYDQPDDVKIDQIVPGMQSVDVAGKVVRTYDINTFQRKDGNQGKVGSALIADETGFMRLVFWDEKTAELEKLNDEQVIQVKNGYTRENNGRTELHVGKNTDIVYNPEGVTIDEIPERRQDQRKLIKDLEETDENITIVGTIVQAFDIRFFEVCPDCGKRARQRGDKFVCNQQHETTEPKFSYVMNLYLDDGISGNIRVVLFKNQIEHLLDKDEEEILDYRVHPEKFSDVKGDLLGEQIKVKGRVQKNDMFDRLEFVAGLVFPADPDEELKNVS